MMKTRNFENKLATIGALLVLFGVFAAATSAFAEESYAVAASETDIVTAADETIVDARRAITESAAEAAKALEAETLFALENHLSDVTSTLDADNT